MADLLARLSHDLMELGHSRDMSSSGEGLGALGSSHPSSGALAYVPVGETRSEIKFEWVGPVKHSVFLAIDGWAEEDRLDAVQATQIFEITHFLPAGRYTYRYKVDGKTGGRWSFAAKPALLLSKGALQLRGILTPTTCVPGLYVLDPLRPTAGALGSKGFEDPSAMRNLLIIVRHSTEPKGDARRKPITTVREEIPSFSFRSIFDLAFLPGRVSRSAPRLSVFLKPSLFPFGVASRCLLSAIQGGPASTVSWRRRGLGAEASAEQGQERHLSQPPAQLHLH